MLPNETKKVLGYRNFYAFYLNSIISEYDRLKELNGERNRKSITGFCHEMNNNLCSFISDLVEIIENNSDINENDNIGESEEEENLIKEYNEILQNENKNQISDNLYD
jgi:hypothetical protein